MAELDNSTKLAMMLASLGNALQGGGDIWSGITRGTNDFFAGMGGLSKMQADAADKQMMMDYHQAQGRRLDAQTAMEQEKARREAAAIEAYVAANGGGGMGVPGAAPSPGMGVPPSGPTMGPGGPITANNPGNMIDGRGGFQTFNAPDEGVAATIKNFQSYPAKFNAGQPMTILQIAQRWAPKDDGVNPMLRGNDPVAWARNVAAATGLPPDQPLDLSNPQIAQALVRGIHVAEKGQGAAFAPAVYQAGADRVFGQSGTQNGPTMTGVQLSGQLAQAGGALPDVTSTTFGQAPVAPPPMQPAQAQPQQPAAPQAPPEVPRPTMREIPRDINDRINGMVGMRQISIDKAEALKNEYLDKLWQQRQQNARSDYEYKRGAGTTQQVPPDELRAAGFPEGTIAQRKRDGSIEVTHAPKGWSTTTTADGQVVLYDSMDPRKPTIPLGPPKPPAAPTESQGKTAARLVRMAAAGPTLDAYESFGTQTGERFLDNVPAGLGNHMQSKDYQKFRAAAETWIVAHLRDDSGGAITKEEWAKYGPIYFPQPGDHADVVAFKRQLRASVESGMKEQTAPSFKMPDRAPVPTPDKAPAPRGAQPVAPKAPPQVGAVENGYRFKGGNPADRNSWEKVQ